MTYQEKLHVYKYLKYYGKPGRQPKEDVSDVDDFNNPKPNKQNGFCFICRKEYNDYLDVIYSLFNFSMLI